MRLDGRGLRRWGRLYGGRGCVTVDGLRRMPVLSLGRERVWRERRRLGFRRRLRLRRRRGRRRRRAFDFAELDLALQLAAELARGTPGTPDPFAELGRYLRQPLRTEHEQRDHEQKDELSATDVEHGRTGLSAPGLVLLLLLREL